MNAVQAPQAKNTSSDFVTKGGKLAGPLGKQSVDLLQKLSQLFNRKDHA
jgi:hypothetical protein